MVLPRVLTAVIAAPLFLWVVHLGSLPFLGFMFVLLLLALWEFHRMAEAGGYATQSWWGIAGGMCIMGAIVFPGLKTGLPFQSQAPALAISFVTAALVLREVFRKDKSLSMLRLAMSCLGILFVIWTLGHMVFLRELRGEGPVFQVGRGATYFLVALIWAQDIAAWAAGLTFGKRRLAPAISPKKSWEGAAAGLLAAVVAALAVRETALPTVLSRPEALALGAVLGVTAQFSDLAESLMKRCFGVKDSSDLLPGHGGVLDRFDSFLFSTPILYFYLVLTGKGS